MSTYFPIGSIELTVVVYTLLICVNVYLFDLIEKIAEKKKLEKRNEYQINSSKLEIAGIKKCKKTERL